MNKNLAALLANVFGIQDNQITTDLTKANVGSWDSLKQMDLVVSLEKEYRISLEIPDIIKMNSVQSIIDVLTDKGVQLGS